jgi:hypothetical protein
MISKNIDVLAVAVLLAVMALYSQAQKVMPVELIPNRGIVAVNHATRCVLSHVPVAPIAPLRPLSLVR